MLIIFSVMLLLETAGRDSNLEKAGRVFQPTFSRDEKHLPVKHMGDSTHPTRA